MANESLIGQYARVTIERGTEPLRKGMRLACRITALWTSDVVARTIAIRGEVVSNDVDGPLPTRLVDGSIVITPVESDVSESVMLQGGPFRANLLFVGSAGETIASGEGSLIRISAEVPFDRLCPDCGGWKICEDCGGTGGEANAPCPHCDGSGSCSRCKGRGVMTETG